MEITIVLVTTDPRRGYRASVKDRPAEREYGDTEEAAIGKLITSLLKDKGAPITIKGIEHL